MRSCWTTGLRDPPLSGFNDCFEGNNYEVKLSWGEVKKDNTCGGREGGREEVLISW